MKGNMILDLMALAFTSRKIENYVIRLSLWICTIVSELI